MFEMVYNLNMKKLIQEIENNLSTKVISYSFLGKGQCNDIYRLETEGKSYCLKIAKDPINSNSCELNSIAVEAKLLERLSSTDIDFIPRFILTSEGSYVYEFIDGHSIKQSFETLGEGNMVSIFKDIARFHYQLSLLKKEDVLELGITEYDPEQQVLKPNQYDLTKISFKQRKIIENAYAIYLRSIGSSLPQLLHNDPHDENIFIINRKPIFIDFGDMIWRDIHYDFSRYVHDYPNYWEIILFEFERLFGQKLNRDRIISISLLRHLRGFLTDINNEVLEEKLCYYKNLLDQK